MKRSVSHLNFTKTPANLNKNLQKILLLGIFILFNLHIAIAQNDEAACDLPVNIGNCDESIARYYFNIETGNCKPFSYSGCEGNANNYENYVACADACNRTTKCPEGDPLQWDWIQDLIKESRACKNEVIRQFEYNGNLYFSVGPWEHCYAADIWTYTYDCQGDVVCYSGGWVSNDDPNSCYNNFRPTLSSTTIWSFEPSCANPFESYIVKSALIDGCTESIYTFDYEDEQYIYIKYACNLFDELYKCNAVDYVCSITETRRSFGCEYLMDAVSPLVNEGNLIWTNTNAYTFTGIIEETDCGVHINTDGGEQLEPLILPEDFYFRDGIYNDFALQSGLMVEFSYTVLSDSTACLTNGIPVEITTIRVVNEICGCDIRDDLPVCGTDGNTYQNPCFAICQGVEVASESPCQVCYDEDPLQADWIKGIIINGGAGCTVHEIRQFEYNDVAHFMVLPNTGCAPNTSITYYNCYGNNIFSNSEIQTAAELANTIWTYDNNPCQDLLELDFVQSWISDSCTESIYQVEFEGDTFLYVNSDGSCFYENYNRNIYDERNIYHCNSGLTFNRLDLIGYEAWDASHAIHHVLLTEENVVWTRPCTYESKAIVKKSNDSACGFIIELNSSSSLYPGIVPSNFILKENQAIEFTYRTLSDRYECSSRNVEIICIRTACVDNEISICAPVSPPQPHSIEYFINEDNASNPPSLQIEEQVEVQAFYTTTTYNYTISDNTGNQKTCATKYHIANQFLQAPNVTQPGVICQEDLWSSIKIAGGNQYKIYNGANVPQYRNALSECTTTGLVCSTSDLNVDTTIPGRRNFSATTYFEFPDGTLCESEASSFHIEVQPNPFAQLSTSNKTLEVGEGMALMDLVMLNKSGYWSGENIVYLMTATGENIAYFSANEAGVYKLYYTVSNDNCERSYLMIVEVDGSSGKAETVLGIEETDLLFANIYPNPATNKVFIELLKQANNQINLMDISGKVIKQISTEQSMIEMNVNDLPKGMYLVEVRNESDTHIQKLIIE